MYRLSHKKWDRAIGAARTSLILPKTIQNLKKYYWNSRVKYEAIYFFRSKILRWVWENMETCSQLTRRYLTRRLADERWNWSRGCAVKMSLHNQDLSRARSNTAPYGGRNTTNLLDIIRKRKYEFNFIYFLSQS